MGRLSEFPWGPVLAIAAALALAGSVIWYEWRYPCTQYRSYPCDHTYCQMHISTGGDHPHDVCVMWKTTHDTCQECVARGDREEMKRRAAESQPVEENRW